MRNRIPKATRRARLRRDVDWRLVDLLFDRLNATAADSPGDACRESGYLLRRLIGAACDAVRHLDNGHPDRARAVLLHPLILIADGEPRLGEPARARTLEEYAREREELALREEILEGRRNIDDLLPPEEEGPAAPGDGAP